MQFFQNSDPNKPDFFMDLDASMFDHSIKSSNNENTQEEKNDLKENSREKTLYRETSLQSNKPQNSNKNWKLPFWPEYNLKNQPYLLFCEYYYS